MIQPVRLPETIVFNLLYVEPGKTGGMESYARELVPQLARLLPDRRLVALLSREGAARYGSSDLGTEVVELPVSAANRPWRAIYEQLALIRTVRGLDEGGLLHSLGNTGPLRTGEIVHVVTIHDMIPARIPAAVNSRWMRPPLVALVNAVARNADRVITDSRNSAGDVAELAGVPAERIDVVPLAGHDDGVDGDEIDVRSRFALPDGPIVLGSAATLAHKNVGALIEAFARVGGDPPPLLALPGYPIPAGHELRTLADRLNVAGRVFFLGWAEAAELASLYRAATCFVFPSLYEGFGLPVLEAMQRGTPVACSNRTSLPEVGGDAALYFDPHNVDSIARCIEQLLADDELRRRLSAAGVRRAAGFTWRRTAEQTVAAYERAVAARSSSDR